MPTLREELLRTGLAHEDKKHWLQRKQDELRRTKNRIRVIMDRDPNFINPANADRVDALQAKLEKLQQVLNKSNKNV